MISRTANENAISVAVGMAHPDMFSGLLILIRIYTNAGAAIPPTAAMAGRTIRSKLDNSPSSISLLSSRPITKKKIAIRPSFTQ